jgi:hypothetical protein
MIKLVTCTWGHSNSFPIESTMLYQSFVNRNPVENFVHFHYNRGAYYLEEQQYLQRMGVQAEYIMFKIELLRKSVAELETDYLIFADATDVFCTDSIEHLPKIFDLDKNIYFSAERNDWPKANMITHWENYINYGPEDRANRTFLNSGVQLAKKEKYLELLDSCLARFCVHNVTGHGGDQGVFAWHYNMVPEPRIMLDYSMAFAWSTYDSNPDEFYGKNNKVYCAKTGISPVFIHDNGTNYGGQKFVSRFGLQA